MSFGSGFVHYTLTTSCGTVSDSIPVTVDTIITPVVTTRSFVCIGRDESTTASAIPSGGSWTSSDTSIATINDTGLVTAVHAFDSTNINYAISNSCGTFSRSVQMYVYTKDQCDSILAVQSVKGVNAGVIIVYPNPNNGTFTVELPAVALKTTITVLDMYGQIIETRVITDSNIEKVNFSFDNLASGSYMIRVNSDGTTYDGKILIFNK